MRASKHYHEVLVCLAASSSALNAGFAISFSSIAIKELEEGIGSMHLTTEEATWFGVYISEVSRASLRGAMGGVFSILLAAGLPLGFCAGISFHWRSIAELGIGLACVTFIICFLLPESPYWLVRQGRVDDATQCIRTLRGKNSDYSAELKDIQCLQQESRQQVKLEEIFSNTFMKPLIIGVCLMVFQQLSGVNAIFFYAHEIFHRADFHNEILASILVSTMQVAALVFATLIIDRVGRKKLLIISGFCMMACHAVLGGCMLILSNENQMNGREDIALTSSPFLEPEFNGNFTVHNSTNFLFHGTGANHQNASSYLKVPDEENHQTVAWVSWLSLAMVMLYVTSYSIGFGPVPFIALSEMLPQRGRGVACGIGTMSNWICAFLLTKLFVSLVDAISTSGVFWLFSSVCLLSVIFVWRFVPETRGKTLTEIQYLFMENESLASTLTIPGKSPKKIIEQAVSSPLLRSKRADSIEEHAQAPVIV